MANNSDIGEIRAKMTLDTTQMDAGLKSTAAAVEPTARAIEKAAKRAADAQVLAQKYVADNVTTEGRKILQARKDETAASEDLRKIQQALNKGYLDETIGGNAAVAAIQRQVAARKELTAVMSQGYTQQMAASAAVRSISTGTPGIRSVERFIDLSPAVAETVSALFPLLGAAGLAGMLAHMGEEGYEAFEKVRKASEETRNAFQNTHDKAAVAIDDLDIENSKIQDQIDKISGHPNNGLATALFEAKKMADELLVSLEADRKQLEELLKEHDTGTLGLMLSGVNMGPEGTKIQGKELLGDQSNLWSQLRQASIDREAATAGITDPKQLKSANEAYVVAVHGIYQKQIDTYKKESKRLWDEQAQSAADAEDEARYSGTATVLDNSKKILDMEGRAKQLDDARKIAEGQARVFAANAKLGEVKQHKEEAGLGNKAAEKRLKDSEAFVAMLKLDGTMTAKAEFDYWDQIKDTFQQGAEQYNQIVQKMSTIAVDGARQAHEKIAKFKSDAKRENEQDPAERERVQRGMDAMNKLQREQGEDLTHTGERWAAYNAEIAKGGEEAQKNAEAMAEMDLAHEVATGQISKYDAAVQLAGIHAGGYTAKLAVLQTQLDSIHASQAQLKFGDEQQKADLAAAEQRVKNEIAQTGADSRKTGQEDQWKQFSETGLGGAVTALQEFIASTKDNAAQMKALADDVLNTVNGSILKDLTSKNRFDRQGVWKDAGKGIFTDVAGMALKKGEGALLGGLFGGKMGKLGTKGNPMFVKSADGAPGGTDIAGGVSGLASLFGKGSSSSAAGGSSSGFGSVISGIASLLPFIPGFAGGTDYFSGGAAWVGEEGPEIVNLPRGASVTPNRQARSVGGDTHNHTWNVDARGSSDPAGVEAAVQRGIRQAAPHLIRASVMAGRSDNSRRPSTMRTG